MCKTEASSKGDIILYQIYVWPGNPQKMYHILASPSLLKVLSCHPLWQKIRLSINLLKFNQENDKNGKWDSFVRIWNIILRSTDMKTPQKGQQLIERQLFSSRYHLFWYETELENLLEISFSSYRSFKLCLVLLCHFLSPKPL